MKNNGETATSQSHEYEIGKGIFPALKPLFFLSGEKKSPGLQRIAKVPLPSTRERKRAIKGRERKTRKKTLWQDNF
jgi:hypothetical protein